MLRFALGLCALLLLATCQPQAPEETSESIAFEKFTLENGLDVVFHIDRSDPVVAVALTAHVGSAREKAGRTGFAHLFEHLLFLESENLGKGGLDQLSARVGGSGANGSTSNDRTNYYQTVPKDALEKMLWAEADKLGWFINTVTDPVLAKEKQVVKNEKRQGVDNRPYGHTNYVIDRNLYPEDHPYHWQVIGSLEDLQNATLADVREFFKRWYVPNNVTLVVAGDFDTEQARAWVERYFGEIPRGEAIPPLEAIPVTLSESVQLYHEDNFARLPELTLAWPTVPLYHPDSYALSILAQYLSQGKQAPLEKALVTESSLAPTVRMYQRSLELAGKLQLSIRAYNGVALDTVFETLQIALATFEAEGIAQEDLDRIQAGLETQFYGGLSSVLGKGFQLAQYNIFAGDPGFIAQDIENTLAVTAEDVMRVYRTYVKGQPYVATSFVPKGELHLALENSIQAAVEEEQIVIGAEEAFDPSTAITEYEPTPSQIDRSVEPPYGDKPQVTIPSVWEESFDNGLEVYGIHSTEVPLVEFSILVDGGPLYEGEANAGTANLLANLMTKGTEYRTAEELESAIQQLGATLTVSATAEDIRISGRSLKRNYPALVALLEEVLLHPRWDEAEFMLVKQQAVSNLQQSLANPNAIAVNEFNALLYGENDPRARNLLGTEESLAAITLADLKAYYARYVNPTVSRMLIVGDVSQEGARQPLESLVQAWQGESLSAPELASPTVPESAQVYFYDVPDAKQSVLRIGYPALAATDQDFYPAEVMNYILGGGGFASRFTQVLREQKGYTYGIRSRFEGSNYVGPFTITCGVRSNVTLESTQLIREILEEYGAKFTEQDLETTKGFLIKSNARAFETSRAKLALLEDMSAYGWPADYARTQEALVENMTVARIRALAEQYAAADKMYWLIVGDAKTQLPRMKELGFGEPVLLNP